ncbi:MAG: hypothetical protein NTY18_08210 [Deltaproteobacteria bacterium]|nr:hypothetical protein [Deltaproteobacteria bacterium]
MRNSFIVSAAMCAALVGCSSGASKGVTVSASAASAVGTAPRTGAKSIDAGNGISIDRLRLVVRRFEIEGSPACAPATPASSGGSSGTGGMGRSMDGSDDTSGDGSDCEVEKGPLLVDLSGADLAGGVHPVAAIDVPSGTYQEVKFQIHAIDATQAGTSAALGEMAAAGASILVDGTMDGKTFQFKSAIEVAQKREGTIVVDPLTGANVTLDVDASGWFKAADGSKLDPSDAAAAPAIEANIRSSIRVVHDDDHDGKDDEGGDHQGSGQDLRAAR